MAAAVLQIGVVEVAETRLHSVQLLHPEFRAVRGAQVVMAAPAAAVVKVVPVVAGLLVVQERLACQQLEPREAEGLIQPFLLEETITMEHIGLRMVDLAGAEEGTIHVAAAVAGIRGVALVRVDQLELEAVAVVPI